MLKTEAVANICKQEFLQKSLKLGFLSLKKGNAVILGPGGSDQLNEGRAVPLVRVRPQSPLPPSLCYLPVYTCTGNRG